MKMITLNVEGMMCTGCENRIKNTLKNIDGVEEVYANHNENTVIVTLSKDIDERVLKEQIEDLDFKVIE